MIVGSECVCRVKSCSKRIQVFSGCFNDRSDCIAAPPRKLFFGSSQDFSNLRRGKGLQQGKNKSMFSRLHDKMESLKTTARMDETPEKFPSYKILPLFPIDIVGLPHAPVSLHIWEPRYLELFNTLSDGTEHTVNAGLVDSNSPFLGTKTLGLLYTTSPADLASLPAVGCEMQVKMHRQLSDGKLLITLSGVTRFRVERLLDPEAAVLSALVSHFPQDSAKPDDEEELEALAEKVRDLFKATLELGRKLQGKACDSIPRELDELDAQGLSFWAGSLISSYEAQQEVLEIPGAKERLEKEAKVLEESLTYLSATSALKGIIQGK